MTALDRKRKESELKAVEAARSNMELKIMEREDEIIRLKEQVQNQMMKEKELKDLLAQE
jgi:hypothetical protein